MTRQTRALANEILQLHPGKTYGEIAVILGTTRGVVAGVIFRAKQPRRAPDRFFHWVRLPDLPNWLDCGWYIPRPNAVMHHHEYSFLCEWLCDCKMPRPM